MKKTAPLAAFFISQLILFSYWFFNNYYPFGERSIAWCDMEQQFIPLLLELKHNIIEKSFFLSSGGGGMSFWGVFFFFISSPLSLLVFFTENVKVIQLVNIITAIKIGIGSATSAIFLRYNNKNINYGFNVVLSLMYSLSGYTMMYYQNNMWLDVMYLFPIYMISLEELFRKGKIMPYIFCLSAMVYLNYYISYMVVFFTIISSVIFTYTITPKLKRKQASFNFIISSVITALITSPIWLLSFMQITDSGRDSSSQIKISEGLFENWTDKLCLISVTSIVLLSWILIFVESRIYRRGIGLYYKIIIPIMIITIFIDPINKLWHTGNYQAYPLRYGFIIILLGLGVIGKYLSYNTGKSNKKSRSFFICALLTLIYIILIMLVNKYYSSKLNSYVETLWVSEKNAVVIIFLAVTALSGYTIIIYNYNRKTINTVSAVLMMLIIFICESAFSFNIYMKNAPDVSDRYNYTISMENKIKDDEFYRVKTHKRYVYSNMLSGMGMETTAHYTSLTDKDFIYSMKRMGYSSYWMDISSNGGTLLTDAFLMNKYVAGTFDDIFSEYTLMYFTDLLKIYKNNTVLNGAIIADVSPQELEEFENKHRMEATEYLSQKLFKTGDISKKVDRFTASNLKYSYSDGIYSISPETDKEDAEIKYIVNIEDKTKLYFDVFGNYSTDLIEDYYGACDVYINGELFEKGYPNKRNNGILNLGTFKEEAVEVRVKLNKSIEVTNFGLYKFDLLEFEENVHALNTGKIDKKGNTIIITGNGDGYVYIPFMYNSGWKAEINGQKTDIYKCLGSFMGIKVNGDDFKITIEFYPSGIILSVILMLLGIIFFLIYTKMVEKIFGCNNLINTTYFLYHMLCMIFLVIVYFLSVFFGNFNKGGTMMFTIFRQTIIMLILIIIGIICYKASIISKESNKELSKLVLYVVNPMVILTSYQTDYEPRLVKNLLLTFVLSIISYIIFIAGAYLLIPKKEARETEIERFSVIYSNCGFMGIPLINALFKSEGVFYLTAFITTFNFVVWTHGIIMLSGKKDLKSVIKVFYSPVIISIALGLIMFFTQIKLPAIVAEAFDFIAKMNTPLAMIVSGITMADIKICNIIKKGTIYYTAFLKLILLPVILIILLSIFNVPEVVKVCVIVAASAPSAATCTLQCVRLGKNSLYASEIFAFTTILSVITLPLVVQFNEIAGKLL